MSITDPRAIYILNVFKDIYPHRPWSYEFWSWGGPKGWAKSTDGILARDKHVIKYTVHPRRMNDPRTFWFDGGQLAVGQSGWVECDLTDHAIVVDTARKLFNSAIA